MKEVVLSGLNGLKGDVNINSFDLPANDPAGGISLTIESSLTNPSSVGVQLSALTFNAFFGSTLVGPVSAANPFTLTPKSTFALPLAGRLIPQEGQGLQDLSTVFNGMFPFDGLIAFPDLLVGFIHGVPSNLVVTGVTAGPPGVTWLNDGIKRMLAPSHDQQHVSRAHRAQRPSRAAGSGEFADHQLDLTLPAHAPIHARDRLQPGVLDRQHRRRIPAAVRLPARHHRLGGSDYA